MRSVFWPREHGPSAYGIGLPTLVGDVFSGPQWEEGGATQRWSNGMDEAVYDRGILRDVYAYSLLNPLHLQRNIDGRPLWAWIQSKPWRGQIAAWPRSCLCGLWSESTSPGSGANSRRPTGCTCSTGTIISNSHARPGARHLGSLLRSCR